MRDKRKPAGFSSRIRGRAQHLQPSLQFSSWRSPRCSARSVRSPLLRISAPFSSALCFFALRPCLSSQSLGSSSAVLLFSQPSRCSFLASHFPQRISLLLRLLLLRSAVCLLLAGHSAWRFRSAIRSIATPPQRFPLAVSPALRPSAFPRRFLSRSAPALPLGGFSRASTQRFSSRERLHAHAPAWKFFSKIPLGIFELRRFFPRLRRFVLCCQRQPASPKRSAATADRRFCGMKGVHTYDPYRSDDRLCIPGHCRAFC